MARIQGVDLPNKKRIDIALTSIFGIGRFLAGEILEKANALINLRANIFLLIE